MATVHYNDWLGWRILASFLVAHVAVTVDGFSIQPPQEWTPLPPSTQWPPCLLLPRPASSPSCLPVLPPPLATSIDPLNERVASLDSSTLSLQMMDRAWEDRPECITRARLVRPFLPVGPPYGATWARSTARAHPERASVISAANSFKLNPISRFIC